MSANSEPCIQNTNMETVNLTIVVPTSWFSDFEDQLRNDITMFEIGLDRPTIQHAINMMLYKAWLEVHNGNS